MKKFFLFAIIATIFSVNAVANDGFVIPTINGKKIHIKGTANGLDIKEYKGKVAFVEFWGTHCPPCLMSIPHYIDLTKKYKDKFALLAIEVQSTPKNRLKSFAKAKGINYDVVAHREAGDFVEYIAQRAQWRGSIPFLLVLDPSGRVVTMQLGLLNEDALAKLIDKLYSDYQQSQKKQTLKTDQKK